MIEEAYARYCALEALLERDEEYLHLKHRLEQATPALESAIQQLSPEEQAAVTEYLGILAEIQQRIAELAAFGES